MILETGNNHVDLDQGSKGDGLPQLFPFCSNIRSQKMRCVGSVVVMKFPRLNDLIYVYNSSARVQMKRQIFI